MEGGKGQQDGPGVCCLIKKPSHHVLHPALDWERSLQSLCVHGRACVHGCLCVTDWVAKGKKRWHYHGVCVPVFLFPCVRLTHHILIFALDFVCSPGLPIITVGYFVRFDILWTADSLCTLGDETCDPHSPLQVYLWNQKEKGKKINILCCCRSFPDNLSIWTGVCMHATIVLMQVMGINSLSCICSVRAIHLIQRLCDQMEHLINPHAPDSVCQFNPAHTANMVPI